MTSSQARLKLKYLCPGVSVMITGLFLIIFLFEFATPPEFVFGYVYTGPILLAGFWFRYRVTFKVTFFAVFLTMLNLWINIGNFITFSTVANRIVASLSLIVTAILSQQLRRSKEAINLTQAKLEAQQKLVQLREDFASTLTHDLKTPLLGAIETLKAFQQEKFGAVSSGQQKVLATMVRSHDSSLQLLETLLDIYRNDTEGLKLNLEPLDLVLIAEEATSTLADLAASRRVFISLSYGDSDFRSSLWVKGDALQLERVFTNLLINAINHSQRGGIVEVVLEAQVSHQVVKILDTGAGIQPEQFTHLFERFYQGNSDRRAKGFGLGLYLSRQIVEAHGGIIWAENRKSAKTNSYSTNSGAIFGFKLPAHAL
ncbi:MAG: HAMP domain-containing histidine kinase [Calothrix sp. C42_A2020_038]|nr:HAMP domain-containing histidine kinase [Calothrix sp. C42_A2020_038]